jgi:UDP-N-acetylmuramyl tripeptide synthase
MGLLYSRNSLSPVWHDKEYQGYCLDVVIQAGREGQDEIKKILKIPGDFNVSNTLAALKVARLLEIPDSVSFKAISRYRGAGEDLTYIM